MHILRVYGADKKALFSSTDHCWGAINEWFQLYKHKRFTIYNLCFCFLQLEQWSWTSSRQTSPSTGLVDSITPRSLRPLVSATSTTSSWPSWSCSSKQCTASASSFSLTPLLPHPAVRILCLSEQNTGYGLHQNLCENVLRILLSFFWKVSPCWLAGKLI